MALLFINGIIVVMDIKKELQKVFRGNLKTDDKTKEFYSHDASLFELVPEIVGFPKDAKDLQAVVSFVNQHKKEHPMLSITPRSAGTDMSGGAIGQSIVLDMTKHMGNARKVNESEAHLQPGVFFRQLDIVTEQLDVMLPCYPASRGLCTVGGMVANNSGGEKSLEYGKTDNFVNELKVVLADSKEYTVKPLNRQQLVRKMSQQDFEGRLYKRTFELLEKNYDVIQAAKPNVTKDSTGYHLWDIWNRETGIFDLTKLFVGSQGTLGIISDIKFRLVPRPKYSGVLVGYLKDIKPLGKIVPLVLSHKPATFECFDDNTLKLIFRFFPDFLQRLGLVKWIALGFGLIPSGLGLLKGMPKLILMVEFNGNSVEEINDKIEDLKKDLKVFPFSYLEKDETEEKAEKFWIMRRESFSMLRSKVKDKHTAPFIDDFVVPPKNRAAFLPKLQKIIKKYKLHSTIAGHLGDGNFHVIPLMQIEDPKERAKLIPAQKEVNELVMRYDGSISGEHNDGLVRGPWLEEMYGKKVFGLMQDIKKMYDPDNIFNPRKKTDATWEFSFNHVRKNF